MSILQPKGATMNSRGCPTARSTTCCEWASRVRGELRFFRASYFRHSFLCISRSCNVRIPADIMVSALGRYFHPACLRCVNCTAAFDPGAKMFTFASPDEGQKPLCESCHVLGPKPCAACKKPLRTGKFVAVRDAHYHALCLKCAVCAAPLSGDAQEHNGHLYCSMHYREKVSATSEQAVLCASCHLGIEGDDGVTALNQNWHAACFRCSESACDVDIAAEGRYYEFERKPLCHNHYMLRMGELCAACGKRYAALHLSVPTFALFNLVSFLQDPCRCYD